MARRRRGALRLAAAAAAAYCCAYPRICYRALLPYSYGYAATACTLYAVRARIRARTSTVPSYYTVAS
jgi:hypothetical protein